MNKEGNGILRIGTSGIALGGSKQSFPPEFQLKSRLNYYSSLFNTLEVNSTFHKLPLPSTFEKWSVDVSDNFQFTIKLWREITHVKRLQTELANIDLFLSRAELIGPKKGCLLVQFPGSITLEYFSQVEQILDRLQQVDDKNQWRKAVEFRSTTWYVRETEELLEEYNASMVLHDMPKSVNFNINKDAAFAYFRFHGPKGDYRDSYTNDFLLERSVEIKRLLSEGKDVYVYFNNTMGSAYENALTLKKMTS